MGSEGYSEECVEDGRTIVSELVANSVRHAQPLADGTIEVTWESTDAALRFSVTDGGSGTRPRTVHAPAMALAGRGMSIVETLAASWWLDGSRSHSTVHALLQVQ
jgi:anti-sigma regulatory factor (Ser/Thr protein kinase)